MLNINYNINSTLKSLRFLHKFQNPSQAYSKIAWYRSLNRYETFYVLEEGEADTHTNGLFIFTLYPAYRLGREPSVKTLHSPLSFRLLGKCQVELRNSMPRSRADKLILQYINIKYTDNISILSTLRSFWDEFQDLHINFWIYIKFNSNHFTLPK